jgi:hypothetical protein
VTHGSEWTTVMLFIKLSIPANFINAKGTTDAHDGVDNFEAEQTANIYLIGHFCRFATSHQRPSDLRGWVSPVREAVRVSVSLVIIGEIRGGRAVCCLVLLTLTKLHSDTSIVNVAMNKSFTMINDANINACFQAHPMIDAH